MSRAFVNEDAGGAEQHPVSTTFEELAEQLAAVGRHCYERGWALGTSGNFSAVVGAAPLTLAITTSGVDKGLLEASHIVAIDEQRHVASAEGWPDPRTTRRCSGQPSAE